MPHNHPCEGPISTTDPTVDASERQSAGHLLQQQKNAAARAAFVRTVPLLSSADVAVRAGARALVSRWKREGRVIAQKIAAALQAELFPAERRRIEAQPMHNLAAYDLYLQGRDYYYRYQKDANETAIQLFKRAIRLDLSYPLGYAGLGDAYALRVNRFGEPEVWADSAIAAAQKAIALDPDLAEAHKALGPRTGAGGGTARAWRRWRRRLISTRTTRTQSITLAS